MHPSEKEMDLGEKKEIKGPLAEYDETLTTEIGGRERISREDIGEIEKRIDEGKTRIGERKEAEPKMGEIPGEVLNKELVYETPGGYVMEISYKNEKGVKKSHYSISRMERIESALDDIRSYKPRIIEEPEEKVESVEEVGEVGKTREIKESKKKGFRKRIGRLLKRFH